MTSTEGMRARSAHPAVQQRPSDAENSPYEVVVDERSKPNWTSLALKIVLVALALLTAWATISYLNSRTVLTPDQLKQYDGSDPSKPVYIAILGQVFDVSSKRASYSPGSSYGFFAGKDGSAAFVTGKFTDTEYAEQPPHVVTGFTRAQLASIVNWREFYHKTYRFVGWLHHPDGSGYYDRDGNPLARLAAIEQEAKIHREQDKKKQKQQLTDYPTCNSMWAQDTGGEVWCENMLVPRLGKLPSETEERCACFTLDKAKELSPHLRVYPNCEPSTSRCLIPPSHK